MQIVIHIFYIHENTFNLKYKTIYGLINHSIIYTREKLCKKKKHRMKNVFFYKLSYHAPILIQTFNFNFSLT